MFFRSGFSFPVCLSSLSVMTPSATFRSRRISPCVGLALLYLCLLPRHCVGKQTGAFGSMGQRDINEMAAGVEQARLSLLDDTRLRRPGEDLGAYLRRIASPLPGEPKNRYFARINGYLSVLAQSADATKRGRRMPPLRDTSAYNQAQWEHAVRALQILPARLSKTQGVWRALQINSHAARNTPAPLLFGFDTQLQQTVQVVIAADDALHNARP